MKYAVLIIDVQAHFSPPDWLIERAQRLATRFPSVATLETHNEDAVPFKRQLGWTPPLFAESLVQTDYTFIKHGYAPTDATLKTLKSFAVDRVLVCGIQADACVLAAGFALFDAGLTPTLVADAVVGSSLDKSGELGVRLWRHHFGNIVQSHKALM